ncbi:DUF1311 domain-containing protein [bacterium D16-51]|nr:DUF1311 domain-containing protein [bacterium D16-59]RKI56708.1 DUF1311 domain-containing protein [bacterium D16-51]
MELNKRKKLLTVISLIIFSFLVTTAAPVHATTGSVYLKRYKNLEKQCKKLFKYDGSQQEMNQESAKEYKLWDKELNYVYKEIYSKLTPNQQKKLKKSELEWIKARDKKAKKSASEFEGGTMYPLIYNETLINLTKKRIKWLIKNYG